MWAYKRSHNGHILQKGRCLHSDQLAFVKSSLGRKLYKNCHLHSIAFYFFKMTCLVSSMTFDTFRQSKQNGYRWLTSSACSKGRPVRKRLKLLNHLLSRHDLARFLPLQSNLPLLTTVSLMTRQGVNKRQILKTIDNGVFNDGA